jgi:hypothetical protein
MRLLARTLLRTATGMARPWVLCLMLLLFAAIASLIVALAGNPASAAIDLVALAVVANFLLGLAIAPSCLMTQRSAWQARVPGLRHAALGVLLCVALLTIALPTAYVISTDAGPAAWSLALLSCSLVAAVAWLLLPVLLAVLLPTLLGWLVREIARFAPALQLGPQAAPSSTFWLLGLALTLSFAVVIRWRQLIRKPQLSLAFNSSLLEKIAAMPDMLRAAASNPNASTSQTPAWLMPRMNKRLSATPTARLRTVLGPPFTPGYQRRMAVFFLATSVVVTLFSLQLNSHFSSRQMLVRIGSQLLLGLIGGTCIAYAQRLALIFRPQSGELAELALLPELVTRDPARSLLLAMLGAVTQTFAVLLALALLLGAAGIDTRLAMTWCAVVWLLQLAVCVRHLSLGRRLIDNAGASTLVWMLSLALSLGVLAGLRALWNLWAASGRTLIVLVTLAGLATLALAMLRWYRHAAQLPQPFMIAADRRTPSKEQA